MSKGFGNLFGSKATPVRTSTSPFAELPQFAQDAFRTGVTGAQGLASQPNVFRPSAFVAGEQALLGADPVNIQSQFGDALSTFQNPFEDQVVQNAIADLQTGAQGFLGDAGSLASGAGAFGGQRQGILEGQIGQNLLEQIGRTSGSLRSQGFQSAADRALQSIGAQASLDRNRALDLLQLGGLQTQQQLAPTNFLLSAAGAVPTSAGSIGLRQNTGALQRIGSAGQSLGGAAGSLRGIFG